MVVARWYSVSEQHNAVATDSNSCKVCVCVCKRENFDTTGEEQERFLCVCFALQSIAKEKLLFYNTSVLYYNHTTCGTVGCCCCFGDY